VSERFLVQIFRGAVLEATEGSESTRRAKRWGDEDIDPLESREPDRKAWVGEGDGDVDYQ